MFACLLSLEKGEHAVMSKLDQNLGIHRTLERKRAMCFLSGSFTTEGVRSCNDFQIVLHAKELLLHGEGMCDRSVYFGPERAGIHRNLPLD